MSKSYWIRSGFYTLSEKAASLLFGFGGAVLLFRTLSKQEFGVWVLFLSITSIFEVGRIGLLQNALVKYLATNEGEKEAGEITTASFVLNVMLTIGIVLVLFGLSIPLSQWLDSPKLSELLQIYSLTTVALIPFFQFNYIQQANLDFRGIFWSNVVKGGILFGFIAWLFFQKTEVNLFQLAVCQAVAAAACSVVAWFFAKKYLTFSRRLDWVWVKKLFHFGKYVFGTNLSTQLYKNVDKLLLGGLPGGGTAAVALYDAAIRVTNLTDVPTASMANILFPQSAKRMNEGKEAVKQLYEKAVGAILAFMLPCILFVELFAEWIIRLVAGPGYADAANLLRLTILFGLFMPYAVQFGTVLDSIGKPKINFVYTIISLSLTVGFNYLFIGKSGAYGAACGTLLAYSATFGMMQAFLYKLLKVNPLNPFGYMLEFYRMLFSAADKMFQAKWSKAVS